MAEPQAQATRELKYLVRIANTDIDGKRPILMGLQSIKGVGFSFANMVCTFADVDKKTKTGMLSDDQVRKITDVLANPVKYGAPVWALNRRRDFETNENKHMLLTDITVAQENDIKRLKKIKSYRGIRHSHGQPTRGQRTRSNFRRNKGKVTLGVQRKKVEAGAAKGDDKGKDKGKKDKK